MKLLKSPNPIELIIGDLCFRLVLVLAPEVLAAVNYEC